MALGLNTESGGERIVISEAESLVQWDATNATKQSSDGLGNMVSTPQSSGAYGIPVNWSATQGMYTYFWISYLDAISINAADTIFSKTQAGKIIYPKHISGYQIATTATESEPNGQRTWLYIGNIYVPAAPGGSLTGAIVDQSEQIFCDVRSNSSLDTLIEYQQDSHMSGVVGSSNTLQLSVDDSFVGAFTAVARCRQIDSGSAVYVNGYRGSSVYPIYVAGGVSYGYVGFSTTDASGVWAISISRDSGTSRFVVSKTIVPNGQTAASVVPSTDALMGTVVWNATLGNFSDGPVTDMRSFGLTGTADIKDLAVTDSKLAGGITAEKMAMPSGTMLVGNANNVGTATAISGDITINNIGTAAIGPLKVLSSMIGYNQVLPANLDSTQDYTVNGLTVQNGANISGSMTYVDGNQTSGKVLTCSNNQGAAVWQALPPAPGVPPAPIRWIAQGDMMTATDVVSTLMDIPATINTIHLSLGTAPTGGTITVDIYKYTWSGTAYSAGVSIFSTPSNRPSFASGASGYISTNLIGIGSVAAGDKLALQIVSSAPVATPGADLLVTIRLS